jgi:hypothetical protein
MNDKKISPVSLVITGVALVLIVILVMYEKHHLVPFIPTPPPTYQTNTSSLTDLTSTPSDILSPQNTLDPSQDTSTTDQSQPSVCYYNSNGYFKITVADGTTATAEVGMGNQSTMLSGTIAVDTTNNGGYVFSGQDSVGGGASVGFDSTHAQLGSLSIPRVDCTQYDMLRGNTAGSAQ